MTPVLLSFVCVGLVTVAALLCAAVQRRRRRAAEGKEHVIRYPEFPALADTLFEP